MRRSGSCNDERRSGSASASRGELVDGEEVSNPIDGELEAMEPPLVNEASRSYQTGRTVLGNGDFRLDGELSERESIGAWPSYKF